MSLLMDALKKAEQEKKEAAKRQQESEASLLDRSAEQASGKLDATDTWEHEVVDGNTTAEIPAMQDGGERTGLHSTTAELELEPITNADDTAEIPRMDASAAVAVEAEDPTLNVTMNELTLAELSRNQMDIDDADAPLQSHSSIEELQTDNADLLDETFHGVALDGIGDNPELFQETVQGEAFLPGDDHSYGETLQGIPAVLLAKDIGSDNQPTPVSAQTVFTAIGTTHSGSGFKWILTGLGTTGLIAAIVWYYVTVTPMNRTLLSPQVAEGIEKIGPPLHETLNLDIGAMSGTLLDDAESSAIGDSGVAVSENEVPVLQSTSSIESLSTAEEDEAQGVVDENDIDLADESDTSDSAAVAAGSLPPQDVLLAHNTEAGLPERIAPELSLIKISRSKTLDDKGKVIRDAYIAYQKGAYGTAVDKYQEALKEFPDNRDALLGLGAIAVNSGDYNKAYHWYARLLSISPRDEFAKAALINLQERSSLPNSESEIKSMLQDSPDAHFLHFTLGNIYAAGSRWAEAQQAFFDAYRLNSSNPDYALNLAISLDHIGQYGSALDYYNAALELSDKTPSRFDTSRVKTRIDDLNKVVEL